MLAVFLYARSLRRRNECAKNGGAHLDFACISTICGSVLQ
ncbi:hypothetical protein DM45_2775 [Burkholderia mallei]|nr:hypothetical protein DM75_4186 [Burkholderia mallei]KGS24870.1 hypothetical protein X941_4957 [Burkholderia pseudomallei MSHR5569]KOS92346.1 hypothetical protein DM45_2775 [Burkholderia mallei]KOT08254.1 hypothetical protein DM77_2305 [Burkholderia mallei]KOT20950.1 hypothetical protein DM52_1345 [Burkholderia mallei]